jgi:hypothetical protein
MGRSLAIPNIDRRQAASATVGLAMNTAQIQFTRLETGVSDKVNQPVGLLRTVRWRPMGMTGTMACVPIAGSTKSRKPGKFPQWYCFSSSALRSEQTGGGLSTA